MKVTDLPYEVLYLVRDVIDFCYPQSLLPVRATCRLLRDIFDKAIKCCLDFCFPCFTKPVTCRPFLLVQSSCLEEDQGILTGPYKFLSRLKARDEAVVFWLVRTTKIIIFADTARQYNDCRLLPKLLLGIFEQWEPREPVVLKIHFTCVSMYSEISDMIESSPVNILVDARLCLTSWPNRILYILNMKKRKHERDYIPKVLETNGPVKIGKKVTDLCVPVCWRYKLPMQLVFSEDCQNLQRVSICMLPFGAAVSLLETVFKQSASLKVLEFRAMSFNYSGPPANLTAPQSLKTRMVANCTFPLRNKNQPPILSLPIKTLRIGCVTHSNLLKCIHLPNLTEVSWTNGVPCQWCQKSHVDWIAHKLTSMEYVVPGITKELVLISVRKAKELHYDSLSSAPLKNISLTYYTMDLSPNCFPLRQGHKSLEFIGVTIRHSTSHYEESAFSAISHVDIVALLGFQQCISNKFPRLKTVSLLCEYEYTDCINNTPPFVFTTQFIHALYTVENGSLQMALRRRDFELRLSK